MYHIRVDTSSKDPIFGYLEKQATACLASEEKAKSGIHCHLFIETKTTIQTIRRHLVEGGFKGNQSYSISTVRDKIKTLAYIMKEVSPFLEKNMLEDDMAKARNYCTQVQADIASKKPKNTYKSICEYLEKKYPKDSLELLGSQVDFIIARIGLDILTILMEQGQVRRFQFQTILDSFCCKHSEVYRLKFIESLLIRK